MFRYQAYFSLDRNDGIENDRLGFSAAPDVVFEAQVTQEQLRNALSILPTKQAQRIRAYYIQGISMVDIAHAEGVTKGAVSVSIQHGIRALKCILKKIFEEC